MPKKKAKKITKKKQGVKHSSNIKQLETTLRKEHKGDAVTTRKIKTLRKQREAGLISEGEHFRDLNKRTKSSKSSPYRKRSSGGVSGGGPRDLMDTPAKRLKKLVR